MFGAAPPDLTVIGRARGADWLYTYLRTFYRDAEFADRLEQRRVPAGGDAACALDAAGRARAGGGRATRSSHGAARVQVDAALARHA